MVSLAQDKISSWKIIASCEFLKAVIRILDLSETFKGSAYSYSFIGYIYITRILDVGIEAGTENVQPWFLWVYTMECIVFISCLFPKGFWVVHTIETKEKKKGERIKNKNEREPPV